MMTNRQALEAALYRSQEDLALHMAYADCLMEEGDSQGEWIRMCLVVEPRNKTNKQRKEWKEFEVARREYYLRHRSNWLGGLASYLVPQDDSGRLAPVHLTWEKGILRGIMLGSLEERIIEEVRMHPMLRKISQLSIVTSESASYDFLRDWPPDPLQWFSVSDIGFGDIQLDLLLNAPCLPESKYSMMLTSCSITDAGASRLAERTSIRRLPFIHLENNLITRKGVRILRQAGIRFDAKRQRRAVDVSPI
jgi:uncharacterized protein (TIGR02996 family)